MQERGGEYKPITYPLSIFQGGMGINGYIHKGKRYLERRLYFLLFQALATKFQIKRILSPYFECIMGYMVH